MQPIRPLTSCLVTGGAGFIGSAFLRWGVKNKIFKRMVNLDALTYAGSLDNVKMLEPFDEYAFVQGDICDEKLVESICKEHEVDVIVHFAAESHVDRSIEDPNSFYKTNVEGTVRLLEVVRRLPAIHFHHVSTDEVYGSLGKEGFFSETSPYLPSSPYSASKAASDHFVRAYANTYRISTTVSHCSNNYGPYQNREKFIPRMILGCLERAPLPVYGSGKNVRDWLYVDDHVEAIYAILSKGKRGQVYDIGGGVELTNIDLLKAVIMQVAKQTGQSADIFHSLIAYVPDRPGHDFRYAIDPSKIERELGFTPKHNFEMGLAKTVLWYLEYAKQSTGSYVEK